MSRKPATGETFNIVVIGQAGRLTYEAVLFAASLRHFDPEFAGRLFVAEPQPGPRWSGDPRMSDMAARTLLQDDLGATLLPFASRRFGSEYPHGNKIEALAALPEGEPFIFFDTDTLVTGPISGVGFDFNRPSASENVTGTWPEPQLYGGGYDQIWRSLFDRFGLDFESSLDKKEPAEYWKRYLYFNAGWFYGGCPRDFGSRYLKIATEIQSDPGPALAAQALYPWLDQIALPLVIHSFGGGRGLVQPGRLDGDTTCHYRCMPLLFARESDAVVDALATVAAPNRIKKVLKSHEPMKRFIYQNRGQKVRAMFDRSDLPRREKVIRNRIKSAGLWMR